MLYNLKPKDNFLLAFFILSFFIIFTVKMCGVNDKVALMEQQRDQVIEVVKEQNKVIELTETISDLKEEVVQEVIQEEKQIEKKTATLIKETEKKVEVVKKTTPPDSEERDLATAEIQIDSLWEAYHRATDTI